MQRKIKCAIVIGLLLVSLAGCTKKKEPEQDREFALYSIQQYAFEWGSDHGLIIDFEKNTNAMICYYEDYTHTLYDTATYKTKVIDSLEKKIQKELFTGGNGLSLCNSKGEFYIHSSVYSQPLNEIINLSFTCHFE